MLSVTSRQQLPGSHPEVAVRSGVPGRRTAGRVGCLLGGIVLAGAAVTGCGTPPELREPAGPVGGSAVPRPSGSLAPWPGASGPAASFPAGVPVPGGTLPGGGLPGGGLPGGPLPGGTLPGGGLPGGNLPGGPLPGAPLPGAPLPGGNLPGVPPPVTSAPLPTPSPRGPSAKPAPRCPQAATATQVLDAVRRSPGLLPAGVRLQVRQGPYCASGWQYAVVQVVVQPEPEPLRVVTRSSGTALTVVTAGTDVCSEPVRAKAPPGIQTLACNGVLPNRAGS